jgi:hypothetical protein
VTQLGTSKVSFVEPTDVIDRIQSTITELADTMGLGPVTRAVDGPALAVPLIAAFDPMHPTLFGFVDDNRVCIGVEWTAASLTFQGIANLLSRSKGRQKSSSQPPLVIQFLACVLATNRVNSTSCAGLDDSTGEIFVRDSFAAVDEEMTTVRNRIVTLINHAREVRRISIELWSRGLSMPEPPESFLDNGYASG